MPFRRPYCKATAALALEAYDDAHKAIYWGDARYPSPARPVRFVPMPPLVGVWTDDAGDGDGTTYCDGIDQEFRGRIVAAPTGEACRCIACGSLVREAEHVRHPCVFCRTWQTFLLRPPTMAGRWSGITRHRCTRKEFSYIETFFEDGKPKDPAKEYPLTAGCVRCRQFYEPGTHVLERWFECCKEFHRIGPCCKVARRWSPQRGHYEMTAEQFMEEWVGIHTPAICARRCADCGAFIENTTLTLYCLGYGLQEREKTCGPTRCNDCFALHRKSGACPEEGASPPLSAAMHRCPKCELGVPTEGPKIGRRECQRCGHVWSVKVAGCAGCYHLSHVSGGCAEPECSCENARRAL